MGNPIYEQQMRNGAGSSPVNNIQLFFKQLQQLKQSGIDPNQAIQNLLSSGKVTQEQYNDAVQRSQQIMQMFGRG